MDRMAGEVSAILQRLSILLKVLVQKHQPSTSSGCRRLCVSAKPSPGRIFWHPSSTWCLHQPARQLFLPRGEQDGDGIRRRAIFAATLARPLRLTTDCLRQHVSKGCWLQLSLTSQVPSSGWMFLPLTGYYVSDPDVVFEPMTDHLPEYSWGLAQYLGAGVAACYRGHRLFDSAATRWKPGCLL